MMTDRQERDTFATRYQSFVCSKLKKKIHSMSICVFRQLDIHRQHFTPARESHCSDWVCTYHGLFTFLPSSFFFVDNEQVITSAWSAKHTLGISINKKKRMHTWWECSDILHHIYRCYVCVYLTVYVNRKLTANTQHPKK